MPDDTTPVAAEGGDHANKPASSHGGEHGAEGLRERLAKLRTSIEAVIEDDHEDDAALAAMIADRVVGPLVEGYRKAVEDAPGGAIWTGACVGCGESIRLGDAITWRLRWSPQGPIHEVCR